MAQFTRSDSLGRIHLFIAKVIELSEAAAIVSEYLVTFDSADRAFSGEMTVIWTFEIAEGGSQVTVHCKDLPLGIRPEDNEAGSELSLDQLARYVQ